MVCAGARLSKSPFFRGWLFHFRGLFRPVWREIHWSKILLVTSWKLTNRTVGDISHRSRHSTCQSFFPRVNLQHDSKSIQTKRVDLEASSRAWSLRSLLRNYDRSTCRKSMPAQELSSLV